MTHDDDTPLVGALPGEVIYAGGESSRIYSGSWLVRGWFRQVDGQYVYDDMEPGDYVACMAMLRAFGDGERWEHRYRVERALIVRAGPA